MIVSIVTPTFNRLDMLKRCVGSVRGQSGVAYEHIIQDGGSTDGTEAWLSGQPDLHGHVEPDEGMYHAINKGWSKASGDILSWLNSDEQYLPGTLATVSDAFQNNPQVDFILGHYIVAKDDGSPIATRRERRLSKLYISNSFLNAASCTLFFRRQLWDEGLIRLDERYRYAADMDMVLRIIQSGARYLCIDRYLSVFTFDGSNLSCHPQMLSETATIRRQHGGFQSDLARNAIICCRGIERLVSGSYRSASVTYDYAVDETPVYRRFSASAVPFFYRTR